MTLDLALRPQNLHLVHAEGTPAQVYLEPTFQDPTHSVDTPPSDATPSGFTIMNGPDFVVGKFTPNIPKGYQFTLFEGKGGVVAYLLSPQGLTYFLLPGSIVKHEGWVCELFGPPITPPSIDPAHTHHPDPLGFESEPETVQTYTAQATVLCAGIGTRILPLTLDELAIGKPALPLCGKETVIGGILNHLARHGFQRIMVNTFCHRNSVMAAIYDAVSALKAKHKHPIEVFEILESRATGTAGGLWTALAKAEAFPGFVDSQAPILVVQGDAVTNVDFSALIEAHVRNKAALTIGCQVVCDQDVPKFGIIGTDFAGRANGSPKSQSGNITQFMEKPKLQDAGPYRLGSSGFYVLSPEVYPVIIDLYDTMLAEAQDKAKSKGEAIPDEVPELDFAKHVFPRLMALKTEHKLVSAATGEPLTIWAEEVSGYWSDIGNPEQYLHTLREVYSGKVKGIQLPEDIEHYVDLEGTLYWPHTYEAAQRDGLLLHGNVIVGKAFETVPM